MMKASANEIVGAAKFMRTLVPLLRPRLTSADIPEEVRQAAERILDAVAAARPRSVALLRKRLPSFRGDDDALLRHINTRQEYRGSPQEDIVARVAAIGSAVLALQQATETRVAFHARHHVSVCWCYLVTATDYDLPVFAVCGSTGYSEAVRRMAETACVSRRLIGIWGINAPKRGRWRLNLCRRYYDPPGCETASAGLPHDFQTAIVRRGDPMTGEWMLKSEPDPYYYPE